MVDVDLDRFVRAHRENYRQALAELRHGKREGQWMWFMFPQIKDLGQTSRDYSLSDVREARIFLNHPMLGVHLMEATRVLLGLEGKSAEEICFLDFKQFTVNDTVFGVGQVNSMNENELKEIRETVEPHLEKARCSHGLNMIFFMLTNIITESSELLCCGPEAREKILNAYDLPEDTQRIMLKGVE